MGARPIEGRWPDAATSTRFARDNLPPRELWPEFKFDLPELHYPERLNCVTRMARPLGRGRGRATGPA